MIAWGHRGFAGFARRHVPVAALVVLGVALVTPSTADADSYTLTNLISCCATAGGTHVTGLTARAINSSGDVAGSANFGSSSVQEAALFRSGKWTDLGSLSAGSRSFGWSLNDSDVVVGSATTSGGALHAFSWSNGVMTDLGTLPNGGGTDGRGVNSKGDVVGSGVVFTDYHGLSCSCDNPFLVPSGGTMSDLWDTTNPQNTTSNYSIDAWGINDSDQVVMGPYPGTGINGPSFVQQPGQPNTGEELPLVVNQYHPLNNAGQIVGYQGAAAKLWTPPGVVTSLPPLPGDSSAVANGVDDLGDVVGVSTTNTGCFEHAVEWSHTDYSHPIDLTSLVSSSGWHLWEAYDINDSGQIVGGGSTAPCPAPQQVGPPLKPYLISPAKGTISGTILTGLDSHGNSLSSPAPLAGEVVTIHRTDATQADISVLTDSHGSYTAQVQIGTYAVTPAASPPGQQTGSEYRFHVDRCSPGSTSGTMCQIALTPESITGSASFTYVKGSDQLTFTLSPARLGDRGGPPSLATLIDRDEAGKPLADKPIDFSPPLDQSILNNNGYPEPTGPRAVACRIGSGAPLYPALGIGGAQQPTPASFDLMTDARGTIKFNVWAGNRTGTWDVRAAEADDGTTAVYQSLAIAGGPSELPAELGSLLEALGAVPHSDKDSADLQRLTLEWLLEHESEDPLNHLDFGPIQSLDSRGVHHAGILFYPRDYDPGNLWKHFNDPRNVPAPTDTAVLGADVSLTRTGPLGSPSFITPLPSLEQWEGAHGDAKPGLLKGRLAETELTFFGWPYPPAHATSPDLYDQFSECIPLTYGVPSVTVHSPLALLFTDSRGRQLGINSRGRVVRSGSGFVNRGRHQTVYVISPGAYTVQLRGTGRGTATLVFDNPTNRGDKITIFKLVVRKGQKGSLRLGAGGPARTLQFAGHKIRAHR
jgi:probable HAF family extracellular repeat protein